MLAAQDLQYASAKLLVGLLTRGLEAPLWVVSPGSRSTPLVLALHELGVPLHHVIDERAAAFFALGVARETGRPAPLLCTSGTALAHYLPAVIEASETCTPMVVVSADRPPELHGCGANQTIEQHGLFGGFVRAELDLGVATDVGFVRAWPGQLVAALECGLRPRAQGPVHLNVPLRLPLEPSPTRSEDAEALHSDVAAALASTRPLAALREPGDAGSAPPLPPEFAELQRALSACLERGGRGLLVAGGLSVAEGDALRPALLELARRTGLPLLAEASSQCRFVDSAAGVHPVWMFDALLRSPAARAHLAPEFILRVGAAPTSKALLTLEKDTEARRFVLTAHGHPDPSRNAEAVLKGAPLAALHALASLSPAPAPTYARQLQALDRQLLAHATALTMDAGHLTEGAVAHAAVEALREDDTLLVGNSLAIRHVDSFATRARALGSVHSQRGASGIDGLIAGACGAASAGRSVLALLGDVSFLHDVGGLASYRPGTSVTLVVLQNGGGRIFEQLPIAALEGAPMRSFTTDHQADLSAAAKLYGHAFARVASVDELTRALREAIGAPRLSVVEACVPPHDAKTRNEQLFAFARQALETLP